MANFPVTLGIDTSCDETSIALLKGEKEVLANVISSQIKIHQDFGGVVPELASRAHLENFDLVLKECLSKAGLSLDQIDQIAVTQSPGLIGCLLVGFNFAKALGLSQKIPVFGVHHLKAHLLSPQLTHPKEYPFLGLVVSGGHTALYWVESFEEIKMLGSTVDDAVGEAYDKVAKMLNLGYPGGPIVDRLAQQGDNNRFEFKEAFVKKGKYHFSFSGLKTAVRRIINQQTDSKEITNPQESQWVRDLCASFQKAAIETLFNKIKRALKELPAKAVLISGGVAMNSYLRALSAKLDGPDLKFQVAHPQYCTDNAAMIAYIGAAQAQKGQKLLDLDQNAYASAALW